MPHKLSEIIALTEQAASQATEPDIKELYTLLGEVALHVANVDLHVKRLEHKSEQ